MNRLLAAALVLVVAVTAVPALAAYRCGVTGVRMYRSCCDGDRAPIEDRAAHIDPLCCERVEAPASDVRAREEPVLPRLDSLPHQVALPDPLIRAPRLERLPPLRDRPPDERLDRFRTVRLL